MTAETREQLGWAILELMGHRKLAGQVSEATIAGGSFLRIDICVAADGTLDEELQSQFTDVDGAPLKRIATQYYGPQSVYAITPTTRDTCLALARNHQPAPVARWELAEQADSHRRPVEDDADWDALGE